VTVASENVVKAVRTLLPRRSDWESARRHPRRDLTAGVTVAIVALPLALASGLGARAGLITAIVAGSLAAIFGGSNLQVTGPTGAMTVVLIPVVHRYGADGVLMVGMLAGALLVLAAFSGLGRAARYLPSPVVEGFTAGIAVVIVLQQVPAMLGTAGKGSKAWQAALDSARNYAHHPQGWSLVVTLAVAAIILVGVRWRPAIPISLAAVAAATVVVDVAHVHVQLLGALHGGIPTPSTAFFSGHLLATLLPSALAVAALGALESLLSATVADGLTVGQRHDPDRELFGQGIANLVTPFFGGVPATGAIARTAVNVRLGASSRLSALTHAVVLAGIVLVAEPLVAKIPVAALAGVLLATCIQMVEVGSLLAIAKATRGDALILLVTLAITVVANLVTAVAVGIGIAVILALRSVARSSFLEQVPLEGGDHDAAEHQLLAEHIVAYRIDGPLFFAAAHRFLLELTEVADVRVVILRMSRVTSLDATGAKVLGDAITRLERRGIVVLLSGIRPQHDQILSALGVGEQLRAESRIFADTPAAIGYARGLVLPALTDVGSG
jgi:SulP family sulfate permease